MVLVMDRQFSKPLAAEFATAPPTDPRIDLERPLPVRLVTLNAVPLGLHDDRVTTVGVS
jgi:hypothetical protein